MARYCCFFCPRIDQQKKELDDTCPTCGRTYSHPLSQAPARISNYTIEKPLSRGFYGATYLARRGNVPTKRVIKISPTSFYTYKAFNRASPAEEADAHARAADGSYHICEIREAFEDQVVVFKDGAQLSCNVMELEFVDGKTLNAYIEGKEECPSTVVAQIAIDLLRMIDEFHKRGLRHNDLHDANIVIEELSALHRRAGEIDGSIRVKAIDLGSVSDQSKSRPDKNGDLKWVAQHIDMLVQRLLNSPGKLSDRDFRIALALEPIVCLIGTQAQNVRLPNIADIVDIIINAFNRSLFEWKPWNTALVIKTFGEHYNAQTLESWHAPSLHVDPGGRWIASVSKPGPQVITGMRGCGKTLLLRSLEFHARASGHQPNEPKRKIIERLQADPYIGLFVSAQRLLDLRNAAFWTIERAITRLFIHYAIRSIHALLHLRDLDKDLVHQNSHTLLATALTSAFGKEYDLSQITSLEELERKLSATAVDAARNGDLQLIELSQAEVFPLYADALTGCSEIWRGKTVFFLLDDVSTRYLSVDRVEKILTGLLFSRPNCSFKFTSEWQTIELGLKSPGRIHPISVDRDLDMFDLGGEVYQLINQRGGSGGTKFVESILAQRAQHLLGGSVMGQKPSDLLGDVPLETVAREIGQANATAKARKEVYRGISCLAHVCVGDIGDVIKLYEEILLRRGTSTDIPIPPSIQSECFHQISSRRLYDLNRRDSRTKDHATTFADASHELLVGSVRNHKGDKPPRIRQYSAIYVRVSTDDKTKQKQQIDLLRELIDAGVFVFSGGGSARIKTKDSNPLLQFILSYRKIYGLASHIGLAERDRYELSGKDLEDWLNTPADGKEILLRNNGGDSLNDDITEPEEPPLTPIPTPAKPARPKQKVKQQTIWAAVAEAMPAPGKGPSFLAERRPIALTTSKVSHEDAAKSIKGILFTSFGFEDRTAAANECLARICKPKRVIAVGYDNPGKSKEVTQAWNAAGVPIDVIPASGISEATVPDLGKNGIVDISGLTKPMIFGLIRSQLARYGTVQFSYATAEKYYPLQDDVSKVLEAGRSNDIASMLEQLSTLLNGESSPYELMPLLEDTADETHGRSLIAFASPKHERIVSLLDQREYDEIDIVVPSSDDPRSKVALLAAGLIEKNHSDARSTPADGSDLNDLIDKCDAMYLRNYSDLRRNVEIGLTGSKLQAAAAAAISTQRKFSQAWYVKPKSFDYAKFTSGFGELSLYKISKKRI